ncbi:hypothetical protein JIG36_35035 [Actinoplanes sp. LDG1-06]|uniref:CHAT domain-containing protein n=1 Tax=Paractinoplanes ovalisporus TaxID=2810368 RepID=A0ABS2ALK3_9ACTN|nr:hypothetical protein [Actinoplanes ovalisporus]MBM2620728.1 hypothetical protein [Actinoplanes ovalisporus]
MAAAATTDWVRLTLNTAYSDVFVWYDDSRGEQVRPALTAPPPPLGSEWVPFPSAGPPGQVLWPARATQFLLGMLARLPIVRPTALEHEDDVTRLAVLVNGPVPSDWPATRDRLRRVLETIGLNDSRIVLMPESRPGGHPAFSLPFDVVVTTADHDDLTGSAGRLVSTLTDEERQAALRIRYTAGIDPDVSADVLVTSAAELSSSSDAVLHLRPRVVVAVGPVDPGVLPAGTSLVMLDPEAEVGPAVFAGRLLREFTHDLPLHEAVTTAAADLGISATLRTTPAGLDDLRLSSAVQSFQDRTHDLPRYHSVGRPSASAFSYLVPPADQLNIAADRAQTIDFEFLRESSGFADLARAEHAWALAQPERQMIDTAGRAIAAQPDALDDLVQSQKRRATLWLTHDRTASAGFRVYRIDERAVLAHGRTYALHVGIGIDWPTDLVDAGALPIGQILPPTSEAEHALDVAVFSSTAEILDQPSQRLSLPRMGPSEILDFRLRMPTGGDSCLVRVHIYHRGHILQAFALRITLDSQEGDAGRPVLRAELVYSRRRQLRDLDDIPPRLLSIATNDDNNGSHRLMFGDTGGAVRLNESHIKPARDFLRDQMADVFALLDSAGHVPSETFERRIKAMALRGQDLWGKFFDEQQQVQDKLDEVAAATTGTLQVVRLVPGFAFPWAMLYDWDLPGKVAEIEAAVVCRGVRGGQVCDCGPTTGNFCVRGFWGIRLVVEELVAQQDADDYITSVSGADDFPTVVSTVGLVHEDHWAMTMIDTLAKGLGPGRCEDLTADQSLLVRLWDPHRRPAVLVVVGHLTTALVDSESRHPRIYVRATEKYLDTANLRTAKRTNGTRRWEKPYRPIILLLGCDTGRTGLDDMHSFVSSLSSAGAAAVIATEGKIDTRLAGELACELVPALAERGAGEALRYWRSQLMADGNPLGLVFTCFGSAGAVVPALAVRTP